MDLFVDGKAIGKISFARRSQPDRLVKFDAAALNTDRFYSDFYSNSENPLQKTREIQFGQIVSQMIPFLGEIQNPRILDVGCGDGHFVSFCQARLGPGFECFGIEPSLTRETKNLKKLSLKEVPTNAKIPTKYSIVSALDVFEHFPEPRACLKDLKKDENGILVIKVPNKRSTLYRMAKLLRLFSPQLSNNLFVRLYQLKYPPPHFFFYDMDSLEEVLGDHFQVLYRGYLSETPLRGLKTRFWGIRPHLKIFAMAAGLCLNLISRGSWNDAALIVARKNAKTNVLI